MLVVSCCQPVLFQGQTGQTPSRRACLGIHTVIIEFLRLRTYVTYQRPLILLSRTMGALPYPLERAASRKSPCHQQFHIP